MKSKPKSNRWKCSHCNKSFKFESEKTRHEQSHDPKFECKFCKKKFSYLSAVRRHEKLHERLGDVKCDQCGRSFRDEDLLKRHMQYAHKGKFTCKKCKAVLSSDLALRSHMKSHRPVSERRYRCQFSGCDRRFNSAQHLKHHIPVHTHEKQYFCKECGKGFIRNSCLKTHQKLHSHVKNLPCLKPECDKKFHSKYSRRKHMMVQHKIKLEYEIEDGIEIEETLISIPGIDPKKEENIKSDETKENAEFPDENDEITNGAEEINKGDEITKASDGNQNEMDYTCKTVLGGCLLKENSNVQDGCICAQMPVDEIPVPEVLENIIINVISENYNEISSDTEQNDDYNQKNADDDEKNSIKINLNDENLTINTPSCERTSCTGCKCYNTCNNRIEEDEIPAIDYVNGTVKINPIDLSLDDNKIQLRKETKVVLSNCTDILGNCIVSGNGTMGEGCLCAKMAMDDRQVIQQQIEEITPHPESTWNNDLL